MEIFCKMGRDFLRRDRQFFAGVCFLVLSLVLSGSALAFPLHPDLAARPDFIDASSTGFDFLGIVALDNCSGSVVRFESSLPTDPAMVLTNGHCNENGMPEPGDVQMNVSSDRQFDLLGSNAESIGGLTAEMILISTMTNTDVTLYRLTESFSDIQSKYGVQALTISANHPVQGTPVQVLSGYWKKGYACSIDKFVYRLNEDRWSMNDSLRYSQPGCEVIGGTSGSPIIDPITRNIVGINNTINENGEKCTTDNPCEVDASGAIFYQQGQAYGQETYWLNTCLDQNRQLNLSVPGCKY